MKKNFAWAVMAFMFFAGTLSIQRAQAQDMSQEEMMAMMMELAAPGPEHEWIAKNSGNWNIDVTYWEGPGAEAQSSTGTVKREMILGGRFMMETSKMTMMGQEVEMLGLFGFDRRSKKFTSIGFDTMGTYYVTSEGTYDDETKTMTMKGTDADPMTGMVNNYTQTIKYIDDDTQVFSMMFEFVGMGVAPFKVVEVTYKRIKAQK